GVDTATATILDNDLEFDAVYESFQAGSGNNPFGFQKLFSDTEANILITGISDGNPLGPNSNADIMGIGTGTPSFDPGELLRFDFFSTLLSYNYAEVFEVTVTNVSLTPTLLVSAVATNDIGIGSAAGQNLTIHNDDLVGGDEQVIPLDPSNIQIIRNGEIINSSSMVTDVSPTATGDGILEIAGLQNGDQIRIVPNSGSEPNRIVFENSGGGSLAFDTLAIKIVDPTLSITGGDGYIEGATIFADTNQNDVLDPGEASGLTDAGGNAELTRASGPLVMYGGKDISTKLPLEGSLQAPEGSSVITPLTTLVVALTNLGLTVEKAEAVVLEKLEMGPGKIDLLNFDPIRASVNGNLDGDAAFAAGVQVYTSLVSIATYLDDVSDGSIGINTAFDAALNALAAQTIANEQNVLLNNGLT
ncbi:MAG: hypothetical protein ACR2PH_10630, partial [Desulfobulbia bacterium]